MVVSGDYLITMLMIVGKIYVSPFNAYQRKEGKVHASVQKWGGYATIILSANKYALEYLTFRAP